MYRIFVWERAAVRKRWALRWRTAAAVRDLAKTLAWDLAGGLRSIVPVSDLAVTVRQAMLQAFAIGQQLTTSGPSDENYQYFGVALPVARMLDWLVRHDPSAAGRTIEGIIGQADRDLDIPRKVAEWTITMALIEGSLDRGPAASSLTASWPPKPTAAEPAPSSRASTTVTTRRPLAVSFSPGAATGCPG